LSKTNTRDYITAAKTEVKELS